MTIIIERFNKINSNISSLKSDNPVKIIAVSKTFSISHIMPLIDHGHVTLERIKYKRPLQSGKI